MPRKPTVTAAAKPGLRREIRWVDLRTLKPLDLNAQVMPFEMFSQLVGNIRRDGCLDSVPLVGQRTGDPDGHWWIVSGNHRIAAAIEAEVFEAEVMFILDPLESDEFLAKQLSHNAINGAADPALLAQLYSQIENIDWRMYSGLDDEALKLLFEAAPASISEAHLEYQTLSFVFLQDELAGINEAFDQARALTSAADERWLARFAQHEQLLTAIATASAAHGIRNQALALRLVLDVFNRHRQDLVEGWWDNEADATRHGHLVPLASVLGDDQVPAPVAAKIRKALHRLATSEATQAAMTHPWSALELWADQTLGT